MFQNSNTAFAQYQYTFPDAPRSTGKIGFVTIDPEQLYYKDPEEVFPKEVPQTEAKVENAPIAASTPQIITNDAIVELMNKLNPPPPKVEYNIMDMTAFLSWCTFSLLKQERIPSVLFQQYTEMILDATYLKTSTILIALHYMDQRFAKEKMDYLEEKDIFSYLIVSLMLANKFNDDAAFSNKSWAEVSGIPIKELNSMEFTWLQAVDYKLSIQQHMRNINNFGECWTFWQNQHSLFNQTHTAPPQPTAPYKEAAPKPTLTTPSGSTPQNRASSFNPTFSDEREMLDQTILANAHTDEYYWGDATFASQTLPQKYTPGEKLTTPNIWGDAPAQVAPPLPPRQENILLPPYELDTMVLECFEDILAEN